MNKKSDSSRSLCNDYNENNQKSFLAYYRKYYFFSFPVRVTSKNGNMRSMI